MAMRVLSVFGVAGLVVSTTVAGCGGPATVGRASSRIECEERVFARNPSDTVTVVLFGAVDLAHAPWGRNREERFVFGHLYETLVKLDCNGEIRPCLARSWRKIDGGWRFELREDARFWDGSRVTARDVAASFQLPLVRGIMIESVTAVDDDHVEVLRKQRDGAADPITLLALPMLAVTKKSDVTGQTMGTGPWRFENYGFELPGLTIIRPAFGSGGPVVRFVLGHPGDSRDIFDGRADAMITDDPAVIEYARSLSHTSLSALGWDRAYVLLSRSRAIKLAQREQVETLPPSLRHALARDAVPVDARGGSSLLRDAEAASFVPVPVVYQSPAPAPGRLAPRIVYAAADPTARGLAERIVALMATNPASSPDARAVALAVPGASSRVRAVGVDTAEFELCLSRGQDFGYVFPFSWCADFPFLTYRFAERAPWLSTHALPQPWEAMIPLVETRAHFIAMSDRIGFIDDRSGTILITIPIPEPPP
jgi:Bacterial extracellular solute-binding proteins, family 5 Middle